ncbi:MAG: tRNA (N(6)-L-threonylcarbamoyladenosine(37)-C(2))-methylthiotransferase MtaB [Clostridia bacterium]
MNVAFCTLGCKVNQYDTQAMRELFECAGYDIVEFEDVADIYLINTCTVTATSDKKSRQMISRAHSLNPDAKIIVTGCYSQRAPEEISNLPGVALVLGTKDRLRVIELLKSVYNGSKQNAVGELVTERNFELLTASHEGRTRAHLKIQEGCDRYCTYCIIPYTRGPLRSRPIASVKDELVKLSNEGYCEVVLTGIHLMSYGKDMKDTVSLADAIQQANDIDGIKRIRLGSLEPQMLSVETVDMLTSNPKICRHFHLSLQSGSDTVLKRMNRRYDTAGYSDCVNRLRAAMPGCAITTDIITGFPGESEEEFDETMRFVEKIGFARIHAFPYSRRAGTKAADMPSQVPRGIKAERTSKLIELGERCERRYIKGFVGSDVDVLFEECNGEWIQGYTDTYIRVRVICAKNTLQGTIAKVHITQAEQEHLTGELI